MRARVEVAAALAIVLMACGEVTIPGGASNEDLRSSFSHGTCKGSGVVRYTALPMAIADVADFTPLGVMVGGHVTPVDHQYLYPVNAASMSRTAFKVYAPFSGNIVLIQPRVKREADAGPAPVGSVDYRVVFEGSCTYWVYYDLMTQLEPEFLAAGGSDLAANKSAYVRVPVTSGQVIGRVGQQTLDLGTVDASVTLPGLLVPAHYAAEPWKVHSMDALDYFDEPLRGQLVAKNKRKALPIGGKIDYDVDGAAVGNWFQVGTNGYGGVTGEGGGSYWTGHLSLVYGHIDPSLVVISMAFPDGSSRQWSVTGNGPAPATVSAASGAVKYEVRRLSGDSVSQTSQNQIEGTVLVQVLANRQLRVEYFAGVAPSSVSGFTGAARLYER